MRGDRRAPGLGKDRSVKGKSGRALGPLGYIIKDAWRKRSRSVLSLAGIASLSFLFIIFSSMDEGLDRYFEEREDDVGIPSDEEKALDSLRGTMNSWNYLITGLCLGLMVLVVANTAAITVIERRVELATLKALGLTSRQVSALVLGSMFVIIYGGIAAGTLLGLAFVPLLDRVEFTLWGEGIGFPMAIDISMILTVLALGTIAGIIGMIPPLLMVSGPKPAEVMKNV